MLGLLKNKIKNTLFSLRAAYNARALKGCRKLGKGPNIRRPVYTHGLEHVEIGNNFKCGARLKIRAFGSWGDQKFNPAIRIGNNVNIESDCHIGAINEVVIEDDVLIASFVYISDHSHGRVSGEELSCPPIERPLHSKGPVRIGRNAWIGEKAVILPGVTIGEGAVIGASAVVTHDVPPHSVVAGNPAKVLREFVMTS